MSIFLYPSTILVASKDFYNEKQPGEIMYTG